jgi:hypothetical protein
VLDTAPALPEIEKAVFVPASLAHRWPSEAVPHKDWLPRWKLSLARTASDRGTVVVVVGAAVVDVVEAVEGTVEVVEGATVVVLVVAVVVAVVVEVVVPELAGVTTKVVAERAGRL